MTIQYKALSIAGFDGSGGAGIQADLKTFSALGCYGMNVLTALAVQNTQGVKSCHAIPTAVISEQLHTIFEDIIPDSIKIGMLHNAEVIKVVADFLRQHAVGIPIVLDPVMVAKSGDALLEEEAIAALKELLIPIVTIITPNIPEAQRLLGHEKGSMLQMGQELLGLGAPYVLLKGGHAINALTSDDVLCEKNKQLWFSTPRIDSKNTHGTGCTLSAAIAANLAKGVAIAEACHLAKNYLSQALEASAVKSVGKGFGPVHHFYHWW